MRNNICAIVLGIFLMMSTGNILAGDPSYVKLPEKKQFLISAGFGYGWSNNPCRNCEGNDLVGGGTFSVSLGYIINEKFKIEFGPAFWIQGTDLVNSDVADSERPNNKRTVVTFAGTYTPFKKTPFSVRLGGGAGILNYTPSRSTVTTEENKFADTEIFKGYSGTLGVSYEMQLCQKLKLYPSVNFWYLHFEQPKINYNSYIDYKQASLTADFRLNLNFKF